MPIADTPWEQVLVVALATYCTGDVTVDAGFGVVTDTCANAGTADTSSKQAKQSKFFMGGALPGRTNRRKWDAGHRGIGFLTRRCFSESKIPYGAIKFSPAGF
jgi:hypothetical protein